MSLGVVLLAHEHLDRVAQVARHWAEAGAPVALHIDAGVDDAAVDSLREKLADCANVFLAPRLHCRWGDWALVEATELASAQLLEHFPEVNRVLLTSGSCLPLRPVAALQAFLAQHPDTDFIESHRVGTVPWTKGGLEEERFSFHFPLSWKQHRKMFDRLVRVQRALGVRRKRPDGPQGAPIEPHLGRQWWCLTRTTLDAILNDPRGGAYRRYFRGVWIPDEAYFQTLARLHSRKLRCASLTLTRFDAEGQPLVFYDDHSALLRRSGAFVARKVWPGAEALYAQFLAGKADAGAESGVSEPGSSGGSSGDSSGGNPAGAEPVLADGGAAHAPVGGALPQDFAEVDALVAEASARRRLRRPGLLSQGCYPAPGLRLSPTPMPYTMFCGFAAVFDGFQPWLAERSAGPVHGRLFEPEGAEFAHGAAMAPGALAPLSGPRDAEPMGFLRNLLWSGDAGLGVAGGGQSVPHAFLFEPGDTGMLLPPLIEDPNATVSMITGAWVLPLWQSGKRPEDLGALVAHHQMAESWVLKTLAKPIRRARLQLWTLTEALAQPEAVLRAACADLPVAVPVALEDKGMPPVPKTEGLSGFITALSDAGFAPLSAQTRPIPAGGPHAPL